MAFTNKKISRISMVMCSLGLLVGSRLAVAAGPKAPKPVKVSMHQISSDGIGADVGSITVKQTKDGIDLMTDLKNLPAGEHGFHLHENGSCDPSDKDGKKTAGQSAGGHWDPDATKAHKGPGGGGHKGDLPKLTVGDNGKVKTKLSVKGLTLADVEGKALMIHEGGDNYGDQPKPMGGGGARVACGVVGGPSAPGGGPTGAKAPAADHPTDHGHVQGGTPATLAAPAKP